MQDETRKDQALKAARTFPSQLHFVLETMPVECCHIAGWAPHGCCFFVRDRALFVKTVLEPYVQNDLRSGTWNDTDTFAQRCLILGVLKCVWHDYLLFFPTRTRLVRLQSRLPWYSHSVWRKSSCTIVDCALLVHCNSHTQYTRRLNI
jgi:hypothetical protein